jgi:hypothetical protein
VYTARPSTNSGFGSLPFGELEVIVSKDFFRLYFDNRFVLEGQFWRDDCSFFSWTLAKSVDDLLFDKAHVRLKKEQFEQLSGEDWLTKERGGYQRRVEAAKAK